VPKIAYEPGASRAQHLGVVMAAEAICEEYARAGYGLTLRALYYRIVARDLFPDSRRWHRLSSGSYVKADPDDPTGTKNADPNYKWLIGIITDARMSGLIDWNHLRDEHRGSAAMYHDDDPAQLIHSAASYFGLDLWEGQQRRVEVWVEKDALSSIVDRVAQRWDVGSFACKGYASATSLWNASRRFTSWIMGEQAVTILYLGDHDPSGMDMGRDVRDRLSYFSAYDLAARGYDDRTADDAAPDGLPWLEVRRIALNMDQIEELNPPPNPTKIGDSRSAGYIAQFGEECWELDAVDPPQMDALISDAIAGIRDEDLVADRRGVQEDRRRMLTNLSDNYDQIESRWDEIQDLLEN
jgi:hypothetical protein